MRTLRSLRTQPRERKYRSSPTCVSVPSAARSRPRGERWEIWFCRLSLANLSDREKEDILDMPIVPEGLWGSALASMQKRCEAKKKEDEALQLCLPRKPPAPSPSPVVQRRGFTQTAPQFKTPELSKPQPAPAPLHGQVTRPGWHRKPPASTAAPQAQPAHAAHSQARKKKRAG